MAIGDIPIPTPSFPRANSVQNMLLGDAASQAPGSRALMTALGAGNITSDEYKALANITPRNTNAAVRGLVAGQVTPGEFLQTQRMVGNPGMTAANASIGASDDLISQALARSAPAASTGGGVARAAAPLADDFIGALGAVAPSVATTPATGGFLSRLMGQGAAARAGGGGLLKAGGIGRAGLYGVGGMLAGGAVDNLNLGGEGSNWDNGLSDAITAGGIGAGIGSMIAPGLGTAIGGGLGLAAGGLWGIVKGDKTNKEGRINDAYTGTRDIIQSLGAQYGLDNSMLQNIMLEFDASAQIMMQQGDEEGLKALVDQMEVNLPGTLLSYRMEQEATKKQNERIMGIQQQFAPIFNSIQARSGMNNQVAYEQALVAADTLSASNPMLADLVRNNAASSRASADNLMAAYASQTAIGMAQGLEGQAAAAAFADNTQPVSL